jgi:hypothetical protein
MGGWMEIGKARKPSEIRKKLAGRGPDADEFMAILDEAIERGEPYEMYDLMDVDKHGPRKLDGIWLWLPLAREVVTYDFSFPGKYVAGYGPKRDIRRHGVHPKAVLARDLFLADDEELDKRPDELPEPGGRGEFGVVSVEEKEGRFHAHVFKWPWIEGPGEESRRHPGQRLWDDFRGVRWDFEVDHTGWKDTEEKALAAGDALAEKLRMPLVAVERPDGDVEFMRHGRLHAVSRKDWAPYITGWEQFMGLDL